MSFTHLCIALLTVASVVDLVHGHYWAAFIEAFIVASFLQIDRRS